jgi:hypothetical protein
MRPRQRLAIRRGSSHQLLAIDLVMAWTGCGGTSAQGEAGMGWLGVVPPSDDGSPIRIGNAA